MVISPGARTKKCLILRVNLTHLVESRDIFFLEAEIVDSTFQWNVLKNIWQKKSSNHMFYAKRALTVLKRLKIKVSSPKFLQNESFLPFYLKCFDLNYTPRKDTTLKIAWNHSL